MKHIEKAVQEDNLAVVVLGYDNSLVMPLEDALNLMRLMKKAERLRSHWDSASQKSTEHLGGGLDNYRVELFSVDRYASVKLNGEYPTEK